MTKLGFTGTRKGMTAEQLEAFQSWLGRAIAAEGGRGLAEVELHHGDSVGADEEAHDFAAACGVWLVVHPPDRDQGRAFCHGDYTVEPAPHLVRNRHIVRAADRLFAAPDGAERVRGSGTWHTVREAGRQRKPVRIVYPDGSTEERQPEGANDDQRTFGAQLRNS